MHIQLQDVLIQMQRQLEQPQLRLSADALIELVNRIRPQDTHNQQDIDQHFEAFLQALVQIPNSCCILQRFILRLMHQYKQTSFYADAGILSQAGFWNQLFERIGGHVLPFVADQSQLPYLLQQVFHQRSDKYWLDAISEQKWLRLLALLDFGHSLQTQKQVIYEQMIKAMTLLSYRISGIALHPEFVQAYPELMNYESPFLVQNRELTDFIERYRKIDQQNQQIAVFMPPDASQVLVMLEQCHDIVLKIRRITKRIGVSINLTYLLLLLEQCLERLELLLALIIQSNKKTVYLSIAELITDVVRANVDNRSVRSLLSTNSELISLQVTENASRTGEHYVSTDKRGFFAMYLSAAGAGVIIAIMATLKTLAARFTLAPLMHAFVNSMNYSLGFMLIHVLHFTVATKQPAMTAAALAATVQHSKGSKTAQVAELAILIINIIRTQFIAILGNISIAIPVAALIALGWEYVLYEPLMQHAKAAKTLHDLNPFTSLAVFHAAIAGVCLFLSGLLAGYFDNMAVYRKVRPRLQNHTGLQRYLGPARLEKFAEYIERNLGALAGNFLFGIMLGSMGTIGYILGLPLDIRHIAFASANFIQGLLTINDPDLGLILISFLGVLLIGLTNLFVSFSLTIIVALRARRVRFEQWKPLAKLVLTHFMTRPADFFWPPKQTSPVIEELEKKLNKS